MNWSLAVLVFDARVQISASYIIIGRSTVFYSVILFSLDALRFATMTPEVLLMLC